MDDDILRKHVDKALAALHELFDDTRSDPKVPTAAPVDWRRHA